MAQYGMAPSATIRLDHHSSARARLRVNVIDDSSWPHIEITTTTGEVTFTAVISASEAAYLAANLAAAAAALPAELDREPEYVTRPATLKVSA